jgi:hypothetical protein
MQIEEGGETVNVDGAPTKWPELSPDGKIVVCLHNVSDCGPTFHLPYRGSTIKLLPRIIGRLLIRHGWPHHDSLRLVAESWGWEKNK